MKNLRTPEMTKNCDISNFQAFPIPDLQKVGFVEYHFFFWHLGRPRYIHTYIHPCIHTYIHTCHLFTHHLSLSHTIFHIRLCTVPHSCFYFSILHHLLRLSFLPHPATTFVAHYWKKLTYGVIWSDFFQHALDFSLLGTSRFGSLFILRS